MNCDMELKAKRSLIVHEEKRNFPYIDTMGKVSIGVGYNLSDRGLSDDWINEQLTKDVNFFYSQLNNFPWFTELNQDRQIILIDMCFMGWKNFLEFEGLIKALENKDYQKAADEMLDSKWAEQVKNRAIALSNGMRTGKYEI